MKPILKRVILALCVVLLAATAGWCIDPFRANPSVFGPKIKGFQLGMGVNRNNAEEFGLTFKGIYSGQEEYEYQGGFFYHGADIKVKGGRVVGLKFHKEIFNAGDMSAKELAQAVMKAYHIPNMEKNVYGDTYLYRSVSDGWQIRVFYNGSGYGGEVEVTPVIIEDTAFD